MTKLNEIHNSNTRTGSKNNRRYVAQSIASIRLIGLHTGKRAISFATFFSDEEIAAQEAAEILKSFYRCNWLI